MFLVFRWDLFIQMCRTVYADMSRARRPWYCTFGISPRVANQSLEGKQHCPNMRPSQKHAAGMKNRPNTCSGYQSAFVRLLVCTRSSMARLCKFCFFPSMRTTSQLSPFTEYLYGTKRISVYPLGTPGNDPHHRHVTQSSRGLARNSLSVELVSSYFSMRSAEKSTTVICD